MEHRDVVILGAGPAGLAAGVLLHRAGKRVQVVERAPRVGGLTATIERGDFRFDLGGHRFYSKNQDVHDFVADLLGDDLLEVPRLSRIHFRGRYVDYPVRPLNALANVGPWTSLRILRDLIELKLRGKPAAPRSLHDWMIASYGRTLYETYFKVYAEKVWGLPADRIHADLAAQRVKGLDLFATLRNALLPRSARAIESMVERFHYPRNGYGQICDRMAAALAPSGSVTLETTPQRIRHDGRRILDVALHNHDDVWTLGPDHLISSIPVTTLVRLLDPPPPRSVLDAADALGFRAVAFVAVFVDRPTVRPESWIYFPSPEISFGRITEPRNWSPALSPPGKTSVVAEHFCDRDDATWQLSDAALTATTIDDMTQKLGFFEPDEVLGSAVIRVPNAYPRMDTAHKIHLHEIERYLDRFENLQTIGRGGMYRYHNTDHVIETAFAASTNVLGGTADVRSVNTALTYHEEKRTA